MVKRKARSRNETHAMKSIPFSKATKDDLVSVLKLNLKTRRSAAFPLTLPRNDIIQSISQTLNESLRYYGSQWSASSEIHMTLVVCAFLREAMTQFQTVLKISAEVALDFDGEGVRFSGFMDLVVSDVDNKRETKRGWIIDEGLHQVLAAAGCLLRSREKNGKKTPILALLTDGAHFKFFAIDERDGAVYRSTTFFIDLHTCQDFSSNTQVGCVGCVVPPDNCVSFSYKFAT